MTWWFQCQSCEFHTVDVGAALEHAKVQKTRWTNKWWAHIMKVMNIDDTESGQTYDMEQMENDSFKTEA